MNPSEDARSATFEEQYRRANNFDAGHPDPSTGEEGRLIPVFSNPPCSNNKVQCMYLVFLNFGLRNISVRRCHLSVSFTFIYFHDSLVLLRSFPFLSAPFRSFTFPCLVLYLFFRFVPSSSHNTPIYRYTLTSFIVPSPTNFPFFNNPSRLFSPIV